MSGLDDGSREMMLETIREYANKNLSPEYLLEVDREGHLPVEKVKEMYDPTKLGIHLLLIPREYGGFGANNYDMYRICELLASIDLGVATAVFATFLGLDPIRVGGTDEQKQKWFTRVAQEGLLIAYGATEAEAGSDLGALKTRAVPVEEDGKIVGYKLSGSKQWISNAGYADIYLILAKDSRAVGWFIMEGGSEGLEKSLPEDKLGIRAANTVAFSMDEVFVPADHLVGMEEGQGLIQAQKVFGATRIMVAAFGLGCGWEALGKAVSYSQGRIQSGGPLSEKQGYTHKLIVPHAVRLEASRAYIEFVARRLDEEGEGYQTEGAIAKLSASEAGNEAADASIQALGGYGYVREMFIEKIRRDVRITQIYEGTSEVLEITIARNRWQEHLKSRSTYFQRLADRSMALHRSSPDVGADMSALALSALNHIFEECRVQKLTRNQHVLMRLGELSMYAETAMVFSDTAAGDDHSKGVRFDQETWKAMARTYAKSSALKVVVEGIKLVQGYGTGDPLVLNDKLKLNDIMKGQAGLMADSDLIAEKLKTVFKKA